MKPLFARKDDPVKERHLVATQNISKDELIFVERPLLSLQSIGNAHQGALCCRCCRSFVGGPDLAIAVASGKIDREHIWEFHKENMEDLTPSCDTETSTATDNYRMVPCRNGCGEIFCSQDCEEEMWCCGGHDFLCTGLIPEPENKSSDETNGEAEICDQLHPLLQFKVFAVQNNEIFIMVADLIAAVVSIRRQQIAFDRKNQAASVDINSEVTLKELLAPYLDFTLVPWWEVATAPLISDPMKIVECIELNRILKELCCTAAKLLYDAFSTIDGDDEFRETLEIAIEESQEVYGLFTQDFFGKIIGSFEQNSMGLRARNPLCRDILEDASLRRRRHDELVKCIELAGMIGDENGECDDGDDDSDDLDIVANIDGMGDIASLECQNEVSDDAGAEEDKDKTKEAFDHMYSIDDIAEFISGLDIDEEGLSTSTKAGDKDHADEEEIGSGDDLDSLFTPLDGTCMYSTACKMNHSCEPNVVARYSYSCSSGGQLARWGEEFPLVLQCIALRDIKDGEELCISYIKSDAPLQERQEVLSNYGFCCECIKCMREKGAPEIQNEDEIQQCDDDLFGEDDMFGDKDGDELFCGHEETEIDTEDDGGGEAVLVQKMKSLNKIEMASTIGSVPISILAPAFSFVNQLGTQLLQELNSSNDDEALVLEMTKATLKSLRERDIIGLKKITSEGEMLTLSLLHKFGGWPSSSLREAHGCFCVVSSICHAEDGNFLPAIKLLDKAAVFGLPRGRLESFFEYVESHVSRITCSHTASFKIPNVTVGDYRLPELQQEVLNKGLKASILNPITEIEAHELAFGCSLGDQQIVIRDYAADWPAINKWRQLRYFSRNHGMRLVPIEHGFISEKGGMKEELMTIQAFVQHYLAKSVSQSVYTLGPTKEDIKRVAYLAQHQLFEQIEDLKKDVIIPTECGKAGPSQANVWIGTGGTRTPLHFDSYDNLFVQVVGSKYIRLYDKSETSKLYVIKGNGNTHTSQGNMSAVDCEKEDYSLHPQAISAKYTEVILFPGDALYIPAKTWHYVRGLSTSASVNFWW